MDTESIGALVGQNAKRLRRDAGISLDDLARASALCGVRWTVSRVSDIEAGRGTPNLATMVVYCAALSGLAGVDIALTDLFEGAAVVQLTDGFEVYASALRRVVAGGSIVFTADDVPHPVTPGGLPDVGDAGAVVPAGSRLPRDSDPAAIALAVASMTGLADIRAAKSLGLDIYELTAWSYRLWGATFGRERDRRAGPSGNAQRRGQVTRGMFTEIRDALAEGDH